ncbi:MAG: DUF2147 domain-containing protein [Betaproteobacteria bacterium]|nr:DUF2147 domain-containing protein [Betaproteobacteria bacterium]
MQTEQKPTMMIHKLICARAVLLALLVMAMSAAIASERIASVDVRGLWVDHRESDQRKVAVWIEDCDGLLCGRIFWLRKPLSTQGQPKRDKHNPDAALRDRPLCGLKILSGFRRVTESTWGGGQIYNASDGRTFSSTISLENDGSLRIRGYVGISLFGKTVEWVRPQENLGRCG